MPFEMVLLDLKTKLDSLADEAWGLLAILICCKEFASRPFCPSWGWRGQFVRLKDVLHTLPSCIGPMAEFKEFERRFKFKPRIKYGWFHLKLYQMFQDLSQRLI